MAAPCLLLGPRVCNRTAALALWPHTRAIEIELSPGAGMRISSSRSPSSYCFVRVSGDDLISELWKLSGSLSAINSRRMGILSWDLMSLVLIFVMSLSDGYTDDRNDPDMQEHFERTLNIGQVSFEVSLSAMVLDIWEHAILAIKREEYSIKCNGPHGVIVTERFVQATTVLLFRRECCSFSNREYVKSGLAELELWCMKAKREYVGSSWDELKHIRQAVGFLVIFQMYRISFDEIVNDLCPVLSVQKLYKICTQYWDDKYNTKSIYSSAPRTAKASMLRGSNRSFGNSTQSSQWQSIIDSLNNLLKTFQ